MSEKLIFTPKSKIVSIMELLICALALWAAFQLPLELAFPEIFEGKTALHKIESSTFFIFAFGILIHFRTAFIDDHTDKLVRVPKKIAMHYIKSSFFIDLVASIPFDFLIEQFVKENGQAAEHLRMLS